MTNILSYTYPKEAPRSDKYFVRANGTPVFVYDAPVEPFAAFSCDGPVDIEIDVGRPIEKHAVRPLHKGIAAVVEGNRMKFSIPGPMNIAVEINDNHRAFLLIFANPLRQNIPAKDDPNAIFFEAGKVHDAGEIVIGSGQTCYLEGGAVVYGVVRAADAKNVSLCGPGVLDGARYRGFGRKYWQSVRFSECSDVTVQDITMIEPTGWMVVPTRCTNVHIDNLHEIAKIIGSDGIDVVSCKDVLIENCMLRNGDDCVVIKSMDPDRGQGPDTENVLVRNCALLNDGGGNALEVGHELRCGTVQNITFRDCDVLHVHGHGAAFSIHNSARAVVKDILFEDIRVEHYYNYLIDCRIINSMWGHDPERGQIRDVTFRDIKVHSAPCNPGYSVSVIGGYDAQHQVENVVLENITINDVKVTNADELDLFTKQVRGIEFR